MALNRYQEVGDVSCEIGKTQKLNYSRTKLNKPMDLNGRKKNSTLLKIALASASIPILFTIGQECDSRLLRYDFKDLNPIQIQGYDPMDKNDLSKALEMEGFEATKDNVETYLQIVNSGTDGKEPGFYDINKDGKVLGVDYMNKGW